MSIRRNPPHMVEVQPMESRKSPRGVPEDVPVGEPVIVPCSVQPVREWSTAEENRQYGLQLLDLRRVFATNWPGDHRSLIYFEGDEYETVGDPQHLNMSRRTAHWAITVRRRRKDKRVPDASP